MKAANLDIVVIMDGPDTVDAATDTSFGLMVAARERGHDVWHCTANAISLSDGSVRAQAHRAIIDEASSWAPLTLGEPADLDLGAVGAVLVRPDPPFDLAYLHLTLLLDHLIGQTPVINAPRGLRDANEKLYALRFPEITPPTIVTADADHLHAFAQTQGGAVIKPIEGHGGRGVILLRPDDPNGASIVDTMTARGQTPVVAQRFLPGVRDGDKRILLLDGEPLGAILRRPTDADFRANICVGGSVEAVEVDEADRRVIAAIAPSLKADGLVFVGIDVIDGYLSEVNVTSPTGLRQLSQLAGTRPDLDVIEWIERAIRR
ncbi:MAG: glutathione synthase [Acidimicrobiales bacterium]|nr:glutathione synthase [Acidimicrobiales bacterium]